jgi:LysR substrate binding domain
MLFAAACAGNGVAVLSTYVAKDALRSGELLPLFPEFPLQQIWLKALVPKRRVGIQRIDALLTWLREHLSPVPPWERAHKAQQHGACTVTRSGCAAKFVSTTPQGREKPTFPLTSGLRLLALPERPR